jgi:hypothetical protein
VKVSCRSPNPAPASTSPWRRPQGLLRRGYTLLEALMASGILLGAVIAVSSAITAGQQNAWEAQQRIAGNLAAEELMGRLLAEPYQTLGDWHGYTEPVGTMTDLGGAHLPGGFDGVGRTVEVISLLEELPGLNVRVQGREITVRAFDTDARTLADLTRFVPEPQS